MLLPPCRGPLSEAVITAMRSGDVVGPRLRRLARRAVEASREESRDPLVDDDVQLTLAVLYEPHFRGFDDAAEDLEWNAALISVRQVLEAAFDAAVRQQAALFADAAGVDLEPGTDVVAGLRGLVAHEAGPSLSKHVLREATLDQVRDYLVQRSAYHLREADPHTLAIPHVAGRAKSALVEIQSDEYGNGRPGEAHSELYARAMRALDLDDTYGAHWPVTLAEAFATVNLMSFLGLHARRVGACLGHLAALEMTSSLPMSRYGEGLRRLGQGPAATGYFDEHVEADAVHEQLAAVDMCGSWAAENPGREHEVLLGAAATLALDARFGTRLLDCWGALSAQGVAA
ncbi:MAG TPA: iron-containing redox enzyme family protein [Motilibacteraceae bacterium]|nr:iron-containing redox enzyme family protein [Motilibacteraceae bacterium]